ncbi:MAG TPA: GNAT family N-acetyltransferase [Marmoricola sp.]
MDVTRTDNSALVADFTLTRLPSLDAGIVHNSVDPAAVRDLVMLLGREGGQVVGAAIACQPPAFPDSWRFVHVCTLRSNSGQGRARRLYDALLSMLAEEVEELTSGVEDDDPVALDVARHWGYEVRQHSVTSQLGLEGARFPDPPSGVSLEACDTLTFDDEAEVEAMALASQTNPEADLGMVNTLAAWRGGVGSDQRLVAALARVEGRPAAISLAIVDGEEMHVSYTGVDPAHRGRDLGRITKQFLHAHAARQGIRTAITDNEFHNAGIRHVNEQLGYTRRRGSYFVTRSREGA